LFFAPDSFKAILCLEGAGSGSSEDGATPQCGIHNCVLTSGKDAVHVQGVGARLRIEQSVVVAGSDAFVFDPGQQPRPRMSVHCVLEHVTVAARQSAMHLKEVARQEPPADPIVVRALASAFLNPFGERSGMLLYEGDALRRGVLVWQSEGTVYDSRLHFGASTPELVPAKSQPHADWSRLWGPLGDRRPVSLPLTAVFDKQRWQLNRLRLVAPRDAPKPPDAGADLVQLGLVKKPSRPPR